MKVTEARLGCVLVENGASVSVTYLPHLNKYQMTVAGSTPSYNFTAEELVAMVRLLTSVLTLPAAHAAANNKPQAMANALEGGIVNLEADTQKAWEKILLGSNGK